MFIIGIGDGLGNQMFQYAFYYAMKKHYVDSTIYLDKDYFYGSVNRHNGFEIADIFGVKVPTCTYMQALALADYSNATKKQHPILSVLWGIRRAITGNKSSYITMDDATCYYREVFELNPLKSYYLRGNWINSQYFDFYRDDIVKLFTFPEITDENNKKIAEEICSSEAISIHLRAGDYLNNANFTQLNSEYYNEAIDIIRREKGKEVKFFVFSDNKEYAEKYFAYLKNKRIVNCNQGKTSYRDMQLMSLCKHNILANSTFSFWGAYLNQNPDKIVVAPKMASKNCRNPFACMDWILL